MKAITGLINGKRQIIILDERKCNECGNVFQPHRQKTLFCSKNCFRRNKRNVLPEKSCPICEKKFIPKQNNSTFCSRSCSGKSIYRKTYRREYLDRKSHGGKRAKLIKENGLKCNRCDTEGSSYDIVAHHITFDPKDHEYQELLCRACHCRLHHSVDKKVLTREQIEDAISKTKNLEEACKILKINRSSLYAKRKKFGLNFSNIYNEKVISKEQIIEAIQSSKTMQEASDKLGIERSVLFDKRRKYNIEKVKPIKTFFERKPLTKDQIQKAIEGTKSLDEACDILGVTRACLYRKRKRFNLIKPLKC